MLSSSTIVSSTANHLVSGLRASFQCDDCSLQRDSSCKRLLRSNWCGHLKARPFCMRMVHTSLCRRFQAHSLAPVNQLWSHSCIQRSQDAQGRVYRDAGTRNGGRVEVDACAICSRNENYCLLIRVALKSVQCGIQHVVWYIARELLALPIGGLRRLRLWLFIAFMILFWLRRAFCVSTASCLLVRRNAVSDTSVEGKQIVERLSIRDRSCAAVVCR